MPEVSKEGSDLEVVHVEGELVGVVGPDEQRFFPAVLLRKLGTLRRDDQRVLWGSAMHTTHQPPQHSGRRS